MVFSKATPGAVQNLRMLVNGLGVVLDGPIQALRLMFNYGLSFEQYNLHLRQKLHL